MNYVLIIRSLNIPHGEPLGIWTFENWSVQISAPGAKIVFEYLTQVLDLIVNFFVKGKMSDPDIVCIYQAL